MTDTLVEIPVSPAPGSVAVLRRRPGVELIGKYEGSGRATETYLARRPDGAYVEVTKLLYWVLLGLDGRRGPAEIAATLGAELGEDVDEADVEFLTEKLFPLGLIDVSDGSDVDEDGRPEMVLGLRVKSGVIPARAVNGFAKVFQAFFYPPVIVAYGVLFVAMAFELLSGGKLSAGVGALVDHPQLTLALFGLMLVSLVFHELGHASACRYGGATPGEIGGGLYVMWPAFYTNVSDSYRLGRAGRVRTDLGGVYFNVVFCDLLGAAYLETRYVPFLLAFFATCLLALEQLLPFVRFDGYWIISDMAGVPDLFPRLAPALRHLVHPRSRHARRGAGPAMTDLHPYSRRIIKVWALATVVILPIEMVLTLLLSATLFVTFALGIGSHAVALQDDLTNSYVANAALDLVQIALLCIFLFGLVYALFFLGYKVVRYSVTRWGERVWSRVLIGVIVTSVLVAPVVWSATQVRLVHA